MRRRLLLGRPWRPSWAGVRHRGIAQVASRRRWSQPGRDWIDVRNRGPSFRPRDGGPSDRNTALAARCICSARVRRHWKSHRNAGGDIVPYVTDGGHERQWRSFDLFSEQEGEVGGRFWRCKASDEPHPPPAFGGIIRRRPANLAPRFGSAV